MQTKLTFIDTINKTKIDAKKSEIKIDAKNMSEITFIVYEYTKSLGGL